MEMQRAAAEDSEPLQRCSTATNRDIHTPPSLKSYMSWLLALCCPQVADDSDDDGFGENSPLITLMPGRTRPRRNAPSQAELQRRLIDTELNRRELHRQHVQRLRDPIRITRAERREQTRRAEWEAVNGRL